MRNAQINRDTLRGMSPAQRLAMAFELTELRKSMVFERLTQRFPKISKGDYLRLRLQHARRRPT